MTKLHFFLQNNHQPLYESLESKTPSRGALLYFVPEISTKGLPITFKKDYLFT